MECKCGCRREVTYYKYKPRSYISGHNSKGEKNNFWNGGRTIRNGYLYLLKPDYFSSDNNGYVTEHVYNFQEYHKCCLLKWGIVHHINEDKLDNKIENLQGMMRSYHLTIHNPLRFRQYKRLDVSDRICSNCHSNNTYTNSNGRYYWISDGNNGWLCRKCYRKERYRNGLSS